MLRCIAPMGAKTDEPRNTVHHRYVSSDRQHRENPSTRPEPNPRSITATPPRVDLVPPGRLDILRARLAIAFWPRRDRLDPWPRTAGRRPRTRLARSDRR